MRLVFATLKGVLFWSYERGTWQYDIMCVLILAFVFLGPNTVFHSKDAVQTLDNPAFVNRQDVKHADPAGMEQDITNHLSKKCDCEVTITRIEPAMDQSGNLIGYSVTLK